MDRWIAEEGEEGQTLLQFISSKLGKTLSKRKVKESIDNGGCRVNSQVERFSNRSVSLGDQIEFLPLIYPKKFSLEKERILFEDSDLLIYNKPAGFVCDQRGVAQLGKISLVHRLDKMTTGVLIFAKNKDAKEKLEDLFRKKMIKKTYLTLVDGIVKEDRGTVENLLGCIGERDGQKMWGVVRKGRLATTKWEVVCRGKQTTLIRCFPITGRTHQIRLHMVELGHPILGDHLYVKQFHCDEFVPRVLLHAEKAAFNWPEAAVLEVRASIPHDFRSVLEHLMSPKNVENVEK